MAHSKAQLQLEAKNLGLSTTGTINDLERRINTHKFSQRLKTEALQNDEADQDIWAAAGSFDDHLEQQPTETLPRHTAIGPVMGVAALVSALFR